MATKSANIFLESHRLLKCLENKELLTLVKNSEEFRTAFNANVKLLNTVRNHRKAGNLMTDEQWEKLTTFLERRTNDEDEVLSSLVNDLRKPSEEADEEEPASTDSQILFGVSKGNMFNEKTQIAGDCIGVKQGGVHSHVKTGGGMYIHTQQNAGKTLNTNISRSDETYFGQVQNVKNNKFGEGEFSCTQ